MNRNNNTLLILGKDVVFIAVGCYLILRLGFLGKLVGALAVIWYGRDLWTRGKVWLFTREEQKKPVERPSQPTRSQDSPILDDGKIQVTDLSGAKEVEFEKE